MDKNDLKSKWQDAHFTDSQNNLSNENLEKTISLKHCKAISKSLLDVKVKVILYALIFAIYAGLMIYALIYLRLNLTLNSIVPLTSVGIFILIIATSEFVRLLVLTKTADNLSLKDSLLAYCRKLKRTMTIDFISYMVFFHLSAIILIVNYLGDIGGIRNLSWDNENAPVPLLAILVLMLLTVPWFIRYHNKRRYKKLFSNLRESIDQLNDKSGIISC